MNQKPSPPRADSPDPRTLPVEREITAHARVLWEKYGRPQGRDVEIWLEAERQLLGTDRAADTSMGPAVAAKSHGDARKPPMGSAPALPPKPRTTPHSKQPASTP